MPKLPGLSAITARSAGKRASGVTVADETLAEPFERVRLRTYRRANPAQAADPDPLVLVFPDAEAVESLGRRAGEWLASSIAKRLPVTVVLVQVDPGVIDEREAAHAAFERVTGGRATALQPPPTKIAVVGSGTGGALSARVAMRARDTGGPVIQRQALISPNFQLLIGPPATSDALVTSLVARLSELPATLVQQNVAEARPLPSEDLPTLLREAGVAVRAIDYPASKTGWAEHPRAVRSSARALDDLVAFLERGIVTDGFDVVPAWNLH